MTENEVRDRLKAYRIDAARKAGMEISREKLKRELKREEDDTREVLAGAGAAKITGMPGAHSIESKVERAAITMIEEPTKEMLRLRELIADTEAQITELTERVRLVEAWLNVLTPDEKYVVTGRMIDGKQWGRIQAEYETDSRRFICTRALYSWSNKGMRKICKAAENVI